MNAALKRIVRDRFVVLSIAALCAACHADPDKPTSSLDKRYSLFTWAPTEGKLCFVLIAYGQSDEFLHRWFPKWTGKCGELELMNAVKALPQDAVVLWEDNPPKGFTYPPEGFMQHVKKFGQEHGVQVVYAPLLIER